MLFMQLARGQPLPGSVTMAVCATVGVDHVVYLAIGTAGRDRDRPDYTITGAAFELLLGVTYGTSCVQHSRLSLPQRNGASTQWEVQK